MVRSCVHTEVAAAEPVSDGCADCRATGDSWVHLRSCLTCGYVGCCDDSPNTHATRHHETTGHPAIVSIEPGESWRYCYVDKVLAPGATGPRRDAPPVSPG
ncbi:UBP-type zinc finger domain-containing protein [Micromonospora sp. WMMD882]|nr:UBP-type zinc finger domain-containing protein [Micromonospora sp. WMMD882]WBB82390.1 UBP-type zinc finger domain-containing protein [Micromonospora sp. WMMD882]